MNSQQRPVALRLAKWHQAMANEPNRNGAKKEKHAITADLLRELLAEPQGEPVAQQRKPLSDEQIDTICRKLGFGALTPSLVVRATEKLHGITGEPT